LGGAVAAAVAMSGSPIELCGDDECLELEAFLIERVYEFNAEATGYFDGRLLGERMRDEGGKVIAGFNGHTWGGCCVISHLWVHPLQRRRGLGRSLLQAAEQEAARRGCEQIVLSTHSFQAPGFYEQAGYAQRAVVHGEPKGHASILYAKPLGPANRA
jgi:GNAT superfamily N-acetyltransferase